MTYVLVVTSIVRPTTDGCVGGTASRTRLTPLLSFQLSSISKAINSTETPVKEKHARRILKKKKSISVLFRLVVYGTAFYVTACKVIYM